MVSDKNWWMGFNDFGWKDFPQITWMGLVKSRWMLLIIMSILELVYKFKMF